MDALTIVSTGCWVLVSLIGSVVLGGIVLVLVGASVLAFRSLILGGEDIDD